MLFGILDFSFFFSSGEGGLVGGVRCVTNRTFCRVIVVIDACLFDNHSLSIISFMDFNQCIPWRAQRGTRCVWIVCCYIVDVFDAL